MVVAEAGAGDLDLRGHILRARPRRRQKIVRLALTGDELAGIAQGARDREIVGAEKARGQYDRRGDAVLPKVEGAAFERAGAACAGRRTEVYHLAHLVQMA